MLTTFHTRALGASILVAVSLGGCADRMALDSTMQLDGTMKGDLATSVKLEGPIHIEMQMQGPTVRYEGTYISDELFDYVKVDTATDEWMVAVFGEPDAKATLKDGSEIWRWTYRPVEQQTSIVEVFSDSEKEPKLATRTVFVTLRNKIVVEKWKA